MLKMHWVASGVVVSTSVLMASMGGAWAQSAGDIPNSLTMPVGGFASARDLDAGTRDARGIPVRYRPRPDYDPIGIRAGSFFIFPSVDVGEYFDSNAYASNTNEETDWLTVISPEVVALSNWSRHALNFRADLAQTWYARNDNLSTLDWSVGTDGRIDVNRSTNIVGQVDFGQYHQSPGSPDFPSNVADPIKYDQLDAITGVNHAFGLFDIGVTGGFTWFDFHDTKSFAGATVDEDFRDRNEYYFDADFGYAYSPDTRLFVTGGYNWRVYRTSQLPDRDSSGFDVEAGVDFFVTDIIEGTVAAGYMQQDYDFAPFGSIEGPSYDVDIFWYATPLTTFRVFAGSDIQETDIALASGYVEQLVGVSADHEILRNLIGTVDFSYLNADYKYASGFTGQEQNDDYIGFGVSLDYLINRYAAVGLHYDFDRRISNLNRLGFNRNVVGISATFQL